MAAPTNETGLVKAIVKALNHRYPDMWITKIHGDPYQTVGIPDLLACLNGQLFAMEVKHPKPGESIEHARGRATAKQLEQLRKISEAGGIAGVVTSVEEAYELVRRVFTYDDPWLRNS